MLVVFHRRYATVLKVTAKRVTRRQETESRSMSIDMKNATGDVTCRSSDGGGYANAVDEDSHLSVS